MKKIVIGAALFLLNIAIAIVGVTCLIVAFATESNAEALPVIGYIGIGAGLGMLLTLGCAIVWLWEYIEESK